MAGLGLRRTSWSLFPHFSFSSFASAQNSSSKFQISAASFFFFLVPFLALPKFLPAIFSVFCSLLLSAASFSVFYPLYFLVFPFLVRNPPSSLCSFLFALILPPKPRRCNPPSFCYLAFPFLLIPSDGNLPSVFLFHSFRPQLPLVFV